MKYRWSEETAKGEVLWRYISCRSGYAVGFVFPSFSHPGKWAWSHEDVSAGEWCHGVEDTEDLAKGAVENLRG